MIKLKKKTCRIKQVKTNQDTLGLLSIRLQKYLPCLPYLCMTSKWFTKIQYKCHQILSIFYVNQIFVMQNWSDSREWASHNNNNFCAWTLHVSPVLYQNTINSFIKGNEVFHFLRKKIFVLYPFHSRKIGIIRCFSNVAEDGFYVSF